MRAQASTGRTAERWGREAGLVRLRDAEVSCERQGPVGGLPPFHAEGEF